MASVIAFLKSLFQKLVALLSKKKGEEVVDYWGPFRKEEYALKSLLFRDNGFKNPPKASALRGFCALFSRKIIWF